MKLTHFLVAFILVLTALVVGVWSADSTLTWSNPQTANGTLTLENVIITNSTIAGTSYPGQTNIPLANLTNALAAVLYTGVMSNRFVGYTSVFTIINGSISVVTTNPAAY